MTYKRIDGIDKDLSALTYGTPWPATRPQTRKEALRCYDMAWEAGFRTFDTAHSYGCGEETLGEWLASRGVRDEAVILDKGCNPGQKESADVFCAATVREQAEESLRRLRTDRVELYILHRDDPSVPVGGIVEELNRLKDEGRILRFGGSNWTMERVLEANAYAASHGLEGFSAVSPAWSLAEYVRDPWGGSVSLSGEGRKPYRDWLRHTQIPVFCYSSLGRGYLSGKFRTNGAKPIEECIAQAPITEYDSPDNRSRLARADALAETKGCTVSGVCLAWLLQQGLNVFPIVAPTGEEHIRADAEVACMRLTPEELTFLDGRG